MRNISRRELLTIAAAGRRRLRGAGESRGASAVFPRRNRRQWPAVFWQCFEGLADGVQEAGRRWGLPNAYILGQEASGAFVGGLRFGEGKMYTRNAGNQPIYWQGPSIGFDAGAEAIGR